MITKSVTIEDKQFIIEPFTGVRALRLSYRLMRVAARPLARFVSENDVGLLLGKAKEMHIASEEEGGDEPQLPTSFKVNLTNAVDAVFENMTEDEFEVLALEVLSKVKYDNMEFEKVWGPKLNNDAGIALRLMKESLEMNFGFFSKILTGLLQKITV